LTAYVGELVEEESVKEVSGSTTDGRIRMFEESLGVKMLVCNHFLSSLSKRKEKKKQDTKVPARSLQEEFPGVSWRKFSVLRHLNSSLLSTMAPQQA
jgi:hypothetical protein